MREFCRVILITLVVGPGVGQAADWPQWRGPTRNGISADTGLLKRWSREGPPLVRTVQGLGDGYASQVIGRRERLAAAIAKRLARDGYDCQIAETLGDGRAKATVRDIRRGLYVYAVGCLINAAWVGALVMVRLEMAG